MLTVSVTAKVKTKTNKKHKKMFIIVYVFSVKIKHQGLEENDKITLFFSHNNGFKKKKV